MTDEPKNPPEYIDYAHRALKSAKLMLDDGDWIGAINRAYYAIFYAANAVLELEGLQRRKHSHVLSVFRQKWSTATFTARRSTPEMRAITSAPSFQTESKLRRPWPARNGSWNG